VIYAGLGLAAAAIVLVAAAWRDPVAKAVRGAVVEATAGLGLKVRTVHLQGASPEASGDILRAAAVGAGAPLLGVDLEAVRQRVEQVGWVRRARVIRLLPDTIVLAVEQRQLIAVWEHAGRVAVIDAEGVVAPEAQPARFSNLPLVVGEGANTAAAAILPAVSSRPRLASRLEALVRVDDRRWDLRLKQGALIQLPADDEEAALIRLDQLDQKARVLDLGLARIDLRDPEMVVVRPRRAAAAGVSEGAG